MTFPTRVSNRSNRRGSFTLLVINWSVCIYTRIQPVPVTDATYGRKQILTEAIFPDYSQQAVSRTAVDRGIEVTSNASGRMRQARSCVTNWATPAQIMGVLFGERGNSFISFFQQSSGRTTLGYGRGKRPGDCPLRIKRNYVHSFHLIVNSYLRVNNACLVESYGRRMREKGQHERKPGNR